jgi:hypothetical protein
MKQVSGATGTNYNDIQAFYWNSVQTPLTPTGGTVSQTYPSLSPANLNTALNFTGGVNPRVYSLFSGVLPTGMTLNTSTGLISGTPTTVQVVTPTIRCVDYTGSSAQQLYSLTIT